MPKMWEDVKYAARTLSKSPGYTAVAVLTLALAIGANTAIFTVVDAALLRSLPYREPDRLVHLWETRTNRQFGQMEASYPNFADWRQQNTVFESIAGYNRTNFTLVGQGTPERISATRVTANFFAVLGVEPQLGRAFRPEEESGAGPDGIGAGGPAAIVTHGFWQRRLGASREALGAQMNLSGTSFTIVGVLPQHFHFALDGNTEVFVPLMMNDDQRARRSYHWLMPIARLKPDVTIEQANTELGAIAARLAEAYRASNAETGARVVPLREEINGAMRPMLLLVFSAVSLLLLLACVNVANLTLARGSARAREIAIRTALGAGRARLMAQLLTESMLLALLGGAAALAIASSGTTFLVGLLPSSFLSRMPFLRELSLDATVFAFGILLTLFTGILFGLMPAWHATRADVSGALKDGGSAGASRERVRLRGALVIAQISLALILLAGTGLVLRSLEKVMNVNPGFRTENLLTMRLSLPAARYQNAGQVASLYIRLEGRVSALPGVRAVALIDEMPVTHDGGTARLFIEGQPEPPPGQEQETVMRTANPSYFSMMGIRLIRGRFFSERDNLDAPLVVLLSETLARQLFPNEDPLGRTLYAKFAQRVTFEVIGVVADVKLAGLDRQVRPSMYTSSLQNPSRSNWLLIRTETDTAQIAAAVRKEVAALDAELPVYGVRTGEDLIRASEGVFLRRSLSTLLGGFALLALLLAALGLYGVMNYNVTQRVREIGLRMALGARAGHVLRLVAGQGLRLAVAGTVIGAAGALAAAQWIRQFLFGVSAADPLTFASVCAVLLAIAILACVVPAWRATRVDPNIVLRYE
ncbi:MAG: ABC transporter permease [Candidatus Acidiferrales bacterium]